MSFRDKHRKLSNFLEMPREVVGEESKITIVGFEEMLIENYKGIAEYEEFYIRINVQIGSVNIEGFNLRLNQITEDDILITGKIEGITFDKKIE